ncbi:hypothetical protein [Oceanobacillus sp. J11TS1]|nr:hypothetical protein [Oceanobacillus sp. J11TS1]GIO23086.1 hypothetical protein J11TS1_16670 [Oceanobacillus sp. J11TS1]
MDIKTSIHLSKLQLYLIQKEKAPPLNEDLFYVILKHGQIQKGW